MHFFDSLYNTYTDHGIETICSILYTPTNAVLDVDKQTNHSDCGLYAIAYAIDLCCDEDVCFRKYDTVTSVLSKCLESRRITAFPSGRSSSHVVAKKCINVRCYCRMPDAGVMIPAMNGSTRNVTCQFLKKPGMINNANGIVKTVTEHKKLIYVYSVLCLPSITSASIVYHLTC